MPRNLQRLTALADMVRTDEMARLGALRARMADLRDQMANLRGAAPAAGDEIGYLWSGAEANWQRWRQQEITRLNRELATVRAETLTQEQKTRVAVARTQVLKRLIESAGE